MHPLIYNLGQRSTAGLGMCSPVPSEQGKYQPILQAFPTAVAVRQEESSSVPTLTMLNLKYSKHRKPDEPQKSSPGPQILLRFALTSILLALE